MAYPDRLLGEDEEVVLDLHPHWKVLVMPVVSAIVAVGLAGFIIGEWHSSIGREVIIMLAVISLLVTSLWPYFKWFTTQYVVTSKRVVIRTGVFSRNGRDIPMNRINDVSFHHNFFDRMLGCGTLRVDSGNDRGEVVLTEVPHVEEVQRTIYRLSEHHGNEDDHA
jgi:uncharacterized membrane protein YdbT with pleckstrin-like domain